MKHETENKSPEETLNIPIPVRLLIIFLMLVLGYIAIIGIRLLSRWIG